VNSMRKNRPLHPTSLQRLFSSLLLWLVFASLLTSCESRRIIVNGLDEKEANEILVFLSRKGIDANKVQVASEGGGGGKAVLWNISVESSQGNEAMALLNQVGLPRRRGQNLLGIFSNVGLVPSGMQEKIRYQAGLAEQIASTIRKIDGVLDADVQISFPDEDPLNPGSSKQKITASVYVKHSGILDDPNAHLITRIKRLLAGSVNGLAYDQVTVIGDRARFSETPLWGSQGSTEEERPYVNVWSIIIAKDSLTLFRIIFFSFTILLLLLLLTLTWIIWKLMPLIRKGGGVKKLFSFHPFDVSFSDASSPLEGEEVKEEGKIAKKEQEKTEEQGGGIS